MKRKNNIYGGIVDIKKIQDMYDHRVKLNTKNKIKLQNFENNYVSNIVYIKNILNDKSYKPGKYNIFLVKEPKIRLIMSQNIIDKLVNHMVSQYFLVKLFDSMFINENIATRKNKGTHYGIKLIKKYLNELKDSEYYVLKFDISKYFFNLDHDIIKEIIRNRIKDKDVLKILDDIIDSTDLPYINEEIFRLKEKEIQKIQRSNCLNKEKLIREINDLPQYQLGKGLPIGNMSSQILAIMYLNELDHFIKEKLKIKYYIRYMDDGIILHKDKQYLEYCLIEITKIIEKYKLKLNRKTMIIHSSQGFEFLGFKYFIKNNKVILKVKNQTKRKFRRKLKTMYSLYDNNKISYKEVQQVQNSYLGHLKHGNTKKLIKVNLEKYNKNKENDVEVPFIIIKNREIHYQGKN